MSIDLMGGTYTLLYLKLLSEKEMCGADIVREMSSRSMGKLRPKSGSLYPLLQRLEACGYVTCEMRGGTKTRSRRMYTITGPGKEYLQDRIENWKNLVDHINNILAV